MAVVDSIVTHLRDRPLLPPDGEDVHGDSIRGHGDRSGAAADAEWLSNADVALWFQRVRLDVRLTDPATLGN